MDTAEILKAYERVAVTREELAAWYAKHQRGPSVYRYQCKACGTRVWGSGLGIGSHNRACKGAPS